MKTPKIINLTDTDETDILDISEIQPGERTVELLHPGTGQKLGISVRIMSADDPRLKREQRALMDRQSERHRKNKILTAEEIESAMVKYLAQTITGWDWGKRKLNGETPEFSVRKAIEILTEFQWIRSQINDAVGDTAAFF
ncbi:hypothetical protein HUU40_00085 [candidate division KSB1 bacterium]|nr:hypothetical protein [candidate division KSB1 bacterium]